MPREIVLGNGELLVNLDRHLFVRDIYYPYVGWANHVGGYRCRIGVWVGGAFAWLDQGWEIALGWRPDSLVTDCTARHSGLNLSLKLSHAVAPHQNLFLQSITVENEANDTREVRIFLAYDLRIDETDIGDTAYYDPFAQALIHYKRDRWFLFAGQVGSGVIEDGQGIAQYACGEKGFRGAEGAWRDAEDGHLSSHAIAQGSVDSVIGYGLTLPAHGKGTLQTWMAAGEGRDQVIALQRGLIERGFAVILTEAEETSRIFANRRDDLDKLPAPVAALFTRSLLVIRTQADKRGAIIASNDSDIMETARAHYSYLWPRDGALVSYALDKLGVREISQPFFEFCARVLPPDRAALLHKYGPDGTVGASWHPWVVDGQPEVPFQEDGTALVIWAFAHHAKTYNDHHFHETLYRRLIRPCALFLASFRDPETHLPLPSWDLWEERRGAHVFTVAAVIAALEAASGLADTYGDPQNALLFRQAASETRAAFLEHFWQEESDCFARMVTRDLEGNLHRDRTVDASAAAVFAFGILPPDDPKVIATMHTLGRKLWVRAGAGGLARYERDYYFRVTDDFESAPGNPWILCTLWLADWYTATAKTNGDLKPALDLLEWAARCALPTGILPEQIHPVTAAPLSVAPLTWSHAQFLQTATNYLERLGEIG